MSTLHEITEAVASIRKQVETAMELVEEEFTVPPELCIKEIVIPLLDVTQLGDNVRRYRPQSPYIATRIVEVE